MLGRQLRDMDKTFHFNTAISSVMELVNEIYQIARNKTENLEYPSVREAIQTVIILLSPFTPHIAEEMWQMLGNKNSIFKTPWPSYDKEMIKFEEISIGIQINGKLRSQITVGADITDDALKSQVLADEKVKKHLKDASVKRFIIVPKKLVNIVV